MNAKLQQLLNELSVALGLREQPKLQPIRVQSKAPAGKRIRPRD